MSGAREDDATTAAERRLLTWVSELGDVQAERDLVAPIMTTARWQALARPYLAATGALVAALGAGARVWGEPSRRR